jgi:hypothetical protein
MTAPYLLTSSSVVPVPPEVAFQGILDAPLDQLFPNRSGPIPPVARCEGRDGPWGVTVGQSRTVVLGDGSSNLETLVAADRPADYRYRLSDFTGPMRGLVAGVDGRFSFVPEGSGTRVTWSWEMHATNPVSRVILPVLGFFWRRYAAAMWPRYAARLPSGAA